MASEEERLNAWNKKWLTKVNNRTMYIFFLLTNGLDSMMLLNLFFSNFQ